jgi:hypothetical protein
MCRPGSLTRSFFEGHRPVQGATSEGNVSKRQVNAPRFSLQTSWKRSIPRCPINMGTNGSRVESLSWDSLLPARAMSSLFPTGVVMAGRPMIFLSIHFVTGGGMGLKLTRSTSHEIKKQQTDPAGLGPATGFVSHCPAGSPAVGHFCLRG